MPPISGIGPAVASRKQPMPRPRSKPFLALAALRAANPSTSATANASSNTPAKSPVLETTPLAAMRVGAEAPRALIRPFPRAAELPRGMQRADIFGVDGDLHAERAADIAG